ncbi:MAG: hypothetical protein JO323_02245 [Acidobacteriia bacterium]|nr:hypothetical protein [Terriglobia bacterium]
MKTKQGEKGASREALGRSIQSQTGLESCDQCPQWLEMKQKIRFAQLLTKASEGLEKRLQTEDLKPSLGDYLKLLQMQKELEEQEPKEIRVTWVDPIPTSELGK